MENNDLIDIYIQFIEEYDLYSELATFLIEKGEDITNFGFSEDEIEWYK